MLNTIVNNARSTRPNINPRKTIHATYTYNAVIKLKLQSSRVKPATELILSQFSKLPRAAVLFSCRRVHKFLINIVRNAVVERRLADNKLTAIVAVKSTLIKSFKIFNRTRKLLPVIYSHITGLLMKILVGRLYAVHPRIRTLMRLNWLYKLVGNAVSRQSIIPQNNTQAFLILILY